VNGQAKALCGSPSPLTPTSAGKPLPAGEGNTLTDEKKPDVEAAMYRLLTVHVRPLERRRRDKAHEQ
jgi:hypothetical protein